MFTSDQTQEQLLESISTLDFVIIEITLYLDNHPEDSGAISRLKSVIEERNEKYQQYTCNYGPLKACDAPIGEQWLWAEQNFPWDA